MTCIVVIDEGAVHVPVSFEDGRSADEFDCHLFGAWATGCMPVSTKTLRRIIRDMESASDVPDAVLKHQPMEEDA